MAKTSFKGPGAASTLARQQAAAAAAAASMATTAPTPATTAMAAAGGNPQNVGHQDLFPASTKYLDQSYQLGPSTCKRESLAAAVEGKISSGVMIRKPGKEIIPSPRPGEVVVFEAFFEAGLGLPAVDFLAEVLDLFHVTLPQLSPNAVARLAIFEWALRAEAPITSEQIVRASEKILGVPTPTEKEWRKKLVGTWERSNRVWGLLELTPPSLLDWVPSEKGPSKRKAEVGASSSAKTPVKKVARKPKVLVPSSPRASASESLEDEGRMLTDLIDKDAEQAETNVEDTASMPESQINLEQVRTSAAQEILPQDEASVDESGVEVTAASIPGEATTAVREDAPTVEVLTADSDEDFGVAFDPPSSPMLTRRQNVEEPTSLEEVRPEDANLGPSTTSEPIPEPAQMGPGKDKGKMDPLPAPSSGSTPSESTDESQSNEGDPSTKTPKTTAQHSGPSPSEDDQQALSLLPLLAPFLERRTGLRTLLEPLDRASREVGETDLVAILSEAESSELNTAMERAAYQQTVLARAANISNERGNIHLREENATLQRNLSISEGRVAHLDVMVSTERRARQGLEAANKELEAEQIVLRAEIEKMRAEHAAAGAELVRLQEEKAKAAEEASQLLSHKNSLTTETARLSEVVKELTSVKDALNEDKLKSEKVAVEVTNELLSVLEYFGTTGTLPSDDNVSLLRRLKRIQGAAKQMKTAGIRYGEISGQVAAIGILRYYEDLGHSITPNAEGGPITFDDDQLLTPSEDVAAAWQAFQTSWRVEGRSAIKAWIDEGQCQKQARAQASSSQPPPDPQALPHIEDVEVLDVNDELRLLWATFDILKLHKRPRFLVPRDSSGAIASEVAKLSGQTSAGVQCSELLNEDAFAPFSCHAELRKQLRMQRRLSIEGGVLRGFWIDRSVVFRHFGNNRDGLRAKPICSFLPPSRHFGLETSHLSSHITKSVFISSGRIFRVSRTVGIGLEWNLRWKRNSSGRRTAASSGSAAVKEEVGGAVVKEEVGGAVVKTGAAHGVSTPTTAINPPVAKPSPVAPAVAAVELLVVA
ncbi:hypothetical protein GUJ93_ZPchr0007g3552 [Zizania palustris]|uniref:Transposase (putative) gypsy type domain-containing protein n=1 Tax=Zizania palustris TaxID=103762 RepID=A0A8J5SVK4_ZIZPA|nr:hypothetical protein GUJ93_ZPchr0007g3552 [Zizania palustris]